MLEDPKDFPDHDPRNDFGNFIIYPWRKLVVFWIFWILGYPNMLIPVWSWFWLPFYGFLVWSSQISYNYPEEEQAAA